MEDRLASLSTTRPWAKSSDQLVADLDALNALRTELDATWLAHVGELEGRGLARSDGATSTAVWLRNRYLMSIANAHFYVKLANALNTAPEPVQDAVAAGDLNLHQAEAIVRSLAALPDDIGVEVRDRAATELVRLAGELDPGQLATAGAAILQLVAPEVADEADRKALERAEAQAHRGRGFTISPDPYGFGYRVHGRLTTEGAAIVRSALDPLCKPTAPSDDRAPVQRRADALVEVCRLALSTTELPRNGGDRPQVVAAIPYDVLKRELGPGTLENGDRVTPETARRMACDARLLPIVFDGAGQPLDVGRMRRLVGAALRQALIARDGGCAFPGCDRPPRWTDAHHVVHWAAGGPTALGNLVLLCGFHHSEIHNPGGWTVHMSPDGLPTFIPPSHIDPEQLPRRNRYHRRQ